MDVLQFMPSRIVILFLFSSLNLSAQNLVPNPGFDDITDCPTQYGQINFAVPWTIANNGTPDLYNECSTGNRLKVPNAGHFIDSYQLQRSGSGYAGIFVYSNSNVQTYEYIETPLSTSLIKGKQYYIEFYVSPDLSPSDYWHYTDAIGLALTDTLYYKEINAHEALPLSPVIENRGTLIKDTIGWTKISGCYIAKGGEKYAIIGNFRKDSETMIEVENPNSYPYNNYFFIEDVLIIPFDPLPDTILVCDSKPIELNAGFLDATYHWNTGETDSTIFIQSGGQYNVEVIMDKCILNDMTIAIDVMGPDHFLTDTIICSDEPLILSSPLAGEYVWSDGSKNRTLSVHSSGLYEVNVSNECGQYIFSTEVEAEDCSCDIYIPNVFSPDNNGINDELQIFIECDFQFRIVQFRVFDRWGNHIYATREEEIKWDGNYKDGPVPSGVYVWFFEYEVIRNGKAMVLMKSGDLSILR